MEQDEYHYKCNSNLLFVMVTFIADIDRDSKIQEKTKNNEHENMHKQRKDPKPHNKRDYVNLEHG